MPEIIIRKSKHSPFLVGKKDREFHILLVYLRQKSRTDVARWLYDQYEKYSPGKLNIRYLIEGLFAMDEFTNDLDSEGDRRGYYVPVRADKKTNTDKYDRIESLAGFFEKHMVSSTPTTEPQIKGS